MSNKQRILDLIRSTPGISDRELREITGITPHQQVNQICRSLASAGLTRREAGLSGVISNYPATPTARANDRGTESATKARPTRAPAAQSLASPVVIDNRSLLVIPCSGAKAPGGTTAPGPSILDALPSDLRDELARRRTANAQVARIDETRMLPALDRYSGQLYSSAGSALRDLGNRGVHTVIISGGYGLVLAKEPIGTYEQVFRPGMWPSRLIQRCLEALASRWGVTSAVGVLAGTTGYAATFRGVRWPHDLKIVTLLAPEPTSGAMVKAPRAQGEALRELASGRLPGGWRSSDGLGMRATHYVG